MAGNVKQACYSRLNVETEGSLILPAKNQVNKAEYRLVPHQAPHPATEPYKLTPVFLGVSVALLVSYIGLWAFPNENYVFATLTNLCYIAAGLQREVAAYVSFHSAARLVGLLGSAPYVFVLLGSASLAYHRHSKLGSWTHSLDIFFGMVLVFHVFYTSFSVVVLKFFGSCDQFQQAVRTGLAFVFAFMIFALMFWFEDIYQQMLLFYLIFGPSAALCGFILRFFLAEDPESKEQWRPRVYIALAEMTTLLLMVFAAIFAQCELIGVEYTIYTNPMAYDFWHGNWHFLLSISMATLYSRTADAALRIRNKNTDITVRSLPVLDWIGLGLGFVYALLVLVLKETEVDLETAKITLSVLASFYGLYGLYALYVLCTEGKVAATLCGGCLGTRKIDVAETDSV